MFPLFLKELKSFIGSLSGYLVIIIFLLLTSLFLWVFPGQTNIIESGYASLAPLFFIAPWVFLFLIPAITMRFFAEENKTGTIELLVTKPISFLEIVLAKFFAGVTLVFLALLPTLTFVYSIYTLSYPIGNIDIGATSGSFIGLFFLSIVFVSIGLFTSSLSNNQIIAFILAIFLCFFFYFGFDALTQISLFSKIDNLIQKLSINYHYSSISRGVIDTRDLIYFISISSIFIFLTTLSLKQKKK